MEFFIGSDHAGLSLAGEIVAFLETRNIKATCFFPKETARVDYPDFARLVCKEVQKNKNNLGILVCGSGLGMSISANKFRGIRAALCVNEYMAKYARMHNDANVLCLGERVVGAGLAKDIVRAFLDSEFEGGRHEVRVKKINDIDGK